MNTDYIRAFLKILDDKKYLAAENKLIILLLSIGIKGLVKRDNWKSYFGEKLFYNDDDIPCGDDWKYFDIILDEMYTLRVRVYLERDKFINFRFDLHYGFDSNALHQLNLYNVTYKIECDNGEYHTEIVEEENNFKKYNYDLEKINKLFEIIDYIYHY